VVAPLPPLRKLQRDKARGCPEPRDAKLLDKIYLEGACRGVSWVLAFASTRAL
jgi:3-methyladenine DNA glycosylase Tag